MKKILILFFVIILHHYSSELQRLYAFEFNNFNDSIIIFSFCMDVHNNYSNKIDKEEDRLYHDYGKNILESDPKSKLSKSILRSYGMDSTFLFPPKSLTVIKIKKPEERTTYERRWGKEHFCTPDTFALRFSSIKYGIKFKYMVTEGKKDITTEGGATFFDDYSTNTLFEGKLIDYRTIAIGPVVNFVFTNEVNGNDIILQTFFLYGYIYNGHYEAAGALRNSGVNFENYVYKTRFDGYSLNVGAGIMYSWNNWIPLTIGLNFIYSYVVHNFNNELTIYQNVGKRISYNDVLFELSVGFRI